MASPSPPNPPPSAGFNPQLSERDACFSTILNIFCGARNTKVAAGAFRLVHTKP
ncbi:unnamed protein product, partial [Musa acuminata subsp. malaccensis]